MSRPVSVPKGFKHPDSFLVLLQEADAVTSKVLCECTLCGVECYVTARSVLHGITKSCGCLKRLLTAPVRASAGSVFNRLTVLEDGTLDTPVLCQCLCGNRKHIQLKKVVRGGVKSCGCLRQEGCASAARVGAPRRIADAKRKISRYRNDGYVVWCWTLPKDVFEGKRRSIQVKEHQVVMEGVLGRELLPEENVHHKNGVRDDNRPSNLELWSSSQPSGQRVEDKLAWAREIVALYG